MITSVETFNKDKALVMGVLSGALNAEWRDSVPLETWLARAMHAINHMRLVERSAVISEATTAGVMVDSPSMADVDLNELITKVRLAKSGTGADPGEQTS